MLFRDNEQMGWLQRMDIRKNHNILILIGKILGQFMTCYATKKTFFHNFYLFSSTEIISSICRVVGTILGFLGVPFKSIFPLICKNQEAFGSIFSSCLCKSPKSTFGVTPSLNGTALMRTYPLRGSFRITTTYPIFCANLITLSLIVSSASPFPHFVLNSFPFAISFSAQILLSNLLSIA